MTDMREKARQTGDIHNCIDPSAERRATVAEIAPALARRVLNTARRNLGPAKAEHEAHEHVARMIESALSAARNAALEEAAERVNQIYGPEANANDPHVQAVLRCRDNIRALKDKE